MRKQTSTGDKIIFSVVKIIDKTNRNDAIYRDISYELDGFNNDIVQFEQSVWGIRENSTGRETIDRTNTQKMIDKSAKSQDFFQSNKDKIERKYTTTRIKPREFLSNNEHVGINREDFYDENFILLSINHKEFKSVFTR